MLSPKTVVILILIGIIVFSYFRPDLFESTITSSVDTLKSLIPFDHTENFIYNITSEGGVQ
jgi:hypothetical protein